VTLAVGIDVGTSGVKALAVDETGEIVARAEEGYPLSTPQPGWAEQDPADWARATDTALEKLGVEAAGIGLSGQMHGLVCLDANEEVIRPAMLWNDQRTGAECAEIEERIGFDRLVALTGNRALTGFTAPKLLWLRTHEPEAYERIASILLPKDYVRLRLTGEHAIDVADASGTLLFDVAHRRWSDEVLSALDVPQAWLPRALESPEVSGQTAQGIPVAAGAGDQAAAALGVGVVAPGTVSVVLGTSGVVFAALPSFVADEQARVHVFCHAVPDLWHAMGVMLSAAGSLTWLRDAVFPGVAFDELTAAAAAWQPGSEGLLFAPYLQGERTPHPDPDVRGAFVGLSLRHDRGALVRAVLEGVAFGLRDSLELLRDLGAAPTVARVSGGGARSALWLEILASVLGIPLEVTSADEGSAYGAALLGGVACGLWDSPREAVEATVRVQSTVEPRREWVETYDALYDQYRALYPTLTWHRRTSDAARTLRAGVRPVQRDPAPQAAGAPPTEPPAATASRSAGGFD
jgi:xylulokinase